MVVSWKRFNPYKIMNNSSDGQGKGGYLNVY